MDKKGLAQTLELLRFEHTAKRLGEMGATMDMIAGAFTSMVTPSPDCRYEPFAIRFYKLGDFQNPKSAAVIHRKYDVLRAFLTGDSEPTRVALGKELGVRAESVSSHLRRARGILGDPTFRARFTSELYRRVFENMLSEPSPYR